ncbi:MAG: GNAT family N-acetyltransferase, partial [Candidatus Parcubacteria bacterium]|nr:GNAT family N-acetyltransferase [Burkholderiales bacterium]
EALRDTAVALPPLNASLSRELMGRTRVARLLAQHRDIPAADEAALLAILQGVSRMVCALPWLKELDLNPVMAHPGGAVIADARMVMDLSTAPAPPRYGHMAVHPYPSELEGTLTLRDGSSVAVRPIRPEDAALEQRFFGALSEKSRYQRFLNQMAQLPPQLLARFTQLDYDRELALVALAPGEGEFIAVGRYAPNADGETAEFALTVADAWQGRGLGRALLEQLCICAKRAGYKALDGQILDANREMRDLAERLGFQRSGSDGDTVLVTRALS